MVSPKPNPQPPTWSTRDYTFSGPSPLACLA
jgi:hypothetical protein